MAGIGAVNISHAAASTHTNQAATHTRDSASTSNSSQQAVISQIASQTAGRQVADDDKQRAVQTPKQAEAGFSANQDEEHKDGGTPVPTRSNKNSASANSPDTHKKIDLTA
jgi:hypothetical protein